MGKRIRFAAMLAALAGVTMAAGLTALATELSDPLEVSEAAGPSSDGWLTVVKADVPVTDRISVTVPIAYGFVVVGAADPQDQTPVSYEKGTLLLPNIRINQAAAGDEYTMEFMGDGKMAVKNYSTITAENLEDQEQGEDSPRQGLAVKLKASVVQEKDSKWTMTDSELTTDGKDARKFRISLNKEFPTRVPEKEGIFEYHGSISLDAPPNVETNGWTAAGTAIIPSEQELSVGVEVGGPCGMYRETEKSVKVGKIHWNVEPVYGNGE